MREATWVNGQVVLDSQPEWTEGRRLIVLEADSAEITTHKIGLDESQWRDDPAAREQWSVWVKTIEPVEFAAPGDFEEEFRRFNIEAVRKQMFGGNE